VNNAMTLSEAATAYGLAYSTLAQAVREHRLNARRSGSTWLTTEDDMNQAIASGRLKPRSDLVVMTADYRVRCPRHGKVVAEYKAQDPAPCGCAWVWEDGLLTVG
jgi:excisionase family DNA binding protein